MLLSLSPSLISNENVTGIPVFFCATFKISFSFLELIFLGFTQTLFQDPNAVRAGPQIKIRWLAPAKG